MSDNTIDLSKGWNSLAADLLYSSMHLLPEKELDFYKRRIRENGGLTLDQACGTGRHLFKLLEAGFETHGADVSADAISFARKAAEKSGAKPELFVQSMQDCNIPHRYGTIFVANVTFQILSDRQEAFRTLELFLKHLTPGGQLLIELFIPYEEIANPESRDYKHADVWDAEPRKDAEGEIVTKLWVESVDPFEQTLLSKRIYDLIVNGKCVHSEEHAHVLRWFFKHEFTMMLERVGFVDIRTYGDYSDEPAMQDSAVVVYGARRPT